MFGHKIPDSIIELLKDKDRVIISQEKGKITFSEDLYKAVCIAIKKGNNDVFSLSSEEREEMNKLKIPFVTIGNDINFSESFVPDRFFENARYENRPFIHGIFDCYTLIRDFFRREHNIILPTNIQRTWEWWLQGENLYLDNAKNYGFVESTDIKIFDVILMKISSDVPNHAAVYIGNNKILHHVSGRFSTTEELNSFYKHSIAVIYRNINL